VTHLVEEYGLWFLFLIVAGESAGLWLPGETALIAAAIYAADGHLSIVGVIVVAAVAAIIGDNIGYWVGRKGGRAILDRVPIIGPRIERLLPAGERFFDRHGGKAVFLARFFGGLRVVAAWVAGISKMHWWTFLMWNAAGGIVWATGVGLAAYYGGKALADSLSRYGLFAGIGIAVIAVLAFYGMRLWHRRVMGESKA
jgi:membrane protein DedA with SNARE-associated domain